MDRLKVERYINKEEGTSQIIFTRNTDTKLEICFGGSLDLYFLLISPNGETDFFIGKDNYAVYEIFDTLYHNIINGIVFPLDHLDIQSTMIDCELYGEDYHDKLRQLEQREKENRKDALELAYEKGLIDGEDIVFRSDDFSLDIAPYFRIRKLDNAYRISFGTPKIEEKNQTFDEVCLSTLQQRHISVRIRNNGSYYKYFNIPFMLAYNALLDLELEHEQIDLEELFIEQEVEQGKSLEKILTMFKRY